MRENTDSGEEKRKGAKKTALLGLLLALALIFSYIEFLLPLPFGIPGIKLGLSNAVILLAMYLTGTREALVLNLMRILLSALLFGTLFSFLYSLFGGVLSFAVMAAFKKTGLFSPLGVSIAGGVSHNIGQLLAAYLFVENLRLFYYIPVLLLSGALTGALIGIVTGEILKRVGRAGHIENRKEP